MVKATGWVDRLGADLDHPRSPATPVTVEWAQDIVLDNEPVAAKRNRLAAVLRTEETVPLFERATYRKNYSSPEVALPVDPAAYPGEKTPQQAEPKTGTAHWSCTGPGPAARLAVAPNTAVVGLHSTATAAPND